MCRLLVSRTALTQYRIQRVCLQTRRRRQSLSQAPRNRLRFRAFAMLSSRTPSLSRCCAVGAAGRVYRPRGGQCQFLPSSSLLGVARSSIDRNKWRCRIRGHQIRLRDEGSHWADWTKAKGSLFAQGTRRSDVADFGRASENDRPRFMVGIPRDNVAGGIAWIASNMATRRWVDG